jgi:hypothetical protein
MKADNPDMKAEHECMETIVNALVKLHKYHYSGDNDSVAEMNGKLAKIRVLRWVVSYFIRGGMIVWESK